LTRSVGIYVRVSTENQVDDGYSVGEQTDKLKKYCEIKDWNVYNVYTDGGWSGSNIKRPGMEMLVKDVKDHQIDTVLVYKLDRLSRSQKDTLYLIEDVFNANDVAFISLNENFDTSTAFGKAMIGILSVFAQLEREQITERMRMGRIGRAKAGYFKGGPHSPFGYDYVDGELRINLVQAEIVKQIFTEYDNGLSLNKLTRKLNAEGHIGKDINWSYRTVRQVLDNDDYIGKVHYLGVSYEGNHQAIISTELYEHVQKELKRRQTAAYSKFNNPRPFVAKYMLSGLLRCGRCGASMSGQANSTQKQIAAAKVKHQASYYIRYYCVSSRPSKLHGAISTRRKDTCDLPTYSAIELETKVLAKIEDMSKHPEKVARLFQRKSVQINTEPLKKRLVDIENQIERFMDLYGSGTISIDKINARIVKLNDEKEALQNKLDQAADKGPEVAAAKMNETLASASEIIASDDYTEQTRLVRSLIDKVILNGNRMTINWNLDW